MSTVIYQSLSCSSVITIALNMTSVYQAIFGTFIGQCPPYFNFTDPNVIWDLTTSYRTSFAGTMSYNNVNDYTLCSAIYTPQGGHLTYNVNYSCEPKSIMFILAATVSVTVAACIIVCITGICSAYFYCRYKYRKNKERMIQSARENGYAIEY